MTMEVGVRDYSFLVVDGLVSQFCFLFEVFYNQKLVLIDNKEFFFLVQIFNLILFLGGVVFNGFFIYDFLDW